MDVEVSGASPELRVGEPTGAVSQSGVQTWRVEIWHEGLKRHRVLRAASLSELEHKASLLASDWEARWANLQKRESGKEEAAARTQEARDALTGMGAILHAGLSSDQRMRWGKLKDNAPFAVAEPTQPRRHPYRRFPDRAAYRARPTLIDRMFPRRLMSVEAKAQAIWEEVEAAWEEDKRRIDQAYEKACREFQNALEQWRLDKAEYESRQRESNAAIDRQRTAFEPDSADSVCPPRDKRDASSSRSHVRGQPWGDEREEPDRRTGQAVV